jgi:seryl-tRNA synthetase
MFDTYKALRKLVKIQQKQTELNKKQNELSKLQKINRKNEEKIQEKIVSLEKEIESLTGTARPTRKQGVKVEEKTEKIIYSVDESTTEKNDLDSKIETFNQLGKHTKKSIPVTMVKNASGNYNLISGDIDGMIETINSMNPKPKCVKVSKMPFGERAGKLTLFINVNKKVDRNGTPLNKKHALNLFKKLGYEVVLK